MNVKLFLVGLLGVLLCVGFVIFRESFTRSTEIQQEAPPRPAREEEILRAFFSEDLAQKKIAHLALSDLQSWEEVTQPRPNLPAIIQRFGEADSVVEEDLSPFGIPQRGRVYYFGRLGLVTPVGRTDQEVFWILIPRG